MIFFKIEKNYKENASDIRFPELGWQDICLLVGHISVLQH